jgi:hypothetical protein
MATSDQEQDVRQHGGSLPAALLRFAVLLFAGLTVYFVIVFAAVEFRIGSLQPATRVVNVMQYVAPFVIAFGAAGLLGLKSRRRITASSGRLGAGASVIAICLAVPCFAAVAARIASGALGLVLLLLLIPSDNHASDEEMIARFREHRSAFIELRDLALADARNGIDHIEQEDLEAEWEKAAPQYPRDDLSSLTAERRRTYLALFDKLGVEMVTIYPGGVEFLASRRGLAVSGSLKAYVWQETPPEPIVSRLDEPLPEEGFATETWFHAFRPVEENWYLHYSAS